MLTYFSGFILNLLYRIDGNLSITCGLVEIGFPPKYKSGMTPLNCAGCYFFACNRNGKIHTWSAYADIICS
jgi:hypothetical protein